MERNPAVAGQFYPGSAGEIQAMIETLIKQDAKQRERVAIVSPHAGYVYSGRVAGATYSRVAIPARVIILAPNHTGRGRMVSLYPGDAWNTPLGRVPIDVELNKFLLEATDIIEEDVEAHAREHSAEVQVPFLQYLRPDVMISVMVLATRDFDALSTLGLALSAAIRNAGETVLIVASSDMTHFESQKAANEKDRAAIARIEAMDPRGLLETVLSQNITMCGVGPVTAALVAALDLGAKSAGLTMYETSGDITGDMSNVVGYAGFLID
jgi:AmmeMemoRadiSam system protein B